MAEQLLKQAAELARLEEECRSMMRTIARMSDERPAALKGHAAGEADHLFACWQDELRSCAAAFQRKQQALLAEHKRLQAMNPHL